MDELINEIAKLTNVSKKEIAVVLKTVKSLLIAKIRGGEPFRWNGLFSIYFKDRKEYKKLSPYDGTEVTVHAGRVTRIKVSKEIKLHANK